jgi:hypothetical protein
MKGPEPLPQLHAVFRPRDLARVRSQRSRQQLSDNRLGALPQHAIASQLGGKGLEVRRIARQDLIEVCER